MHGIKFHYPNHDRRQISNTMGSYAINSTNTGYGMVFSIPKTGTINSVSFVVRSITTAANIVVGLYSLNSNSLPDTLYNGSQTVTLSSYSVGANTVTLPAPVNTTRGDKVALCISWESTAGNVSIAYRDNSYVQTAYPFRVFCYNSVWTKYSSVGGEPATWLTYSDGKDYIPYRCSAEVSYGYDSISSETKAEAGISFIPPIDLLVSGMVIADNNATYGNKYNLYCDKSLLHSYTKNAYSIGAAGFAYIEFDRPILLKQGSRYNLVIQGDINSARFFQVKFSTEDLKTQYFNDSTLCKCSRTSYGDWTYTQTEIPVFSLIVEDIQLSINRRTSTGR